MVHRFIPILLAACCTQVNSFNPSAVVNTRLDLDFVQRPLPTVKAEESSCTTSENLRELPPVIQSIADERREFQMNLGKAMDTLRKDMPEILKRAPGENFFD
jgi:hypothetical protein